MSYGEGPPTPQSYSAAYTPTLTPSFAPTYVLNADGGTFGASAAAAAKKKKTGHIVWVVVKWVLIAFAILFVLSLVFGLMEGACSKKKKDKAAKGDDDTDSAYCKVVNGIAKGVDTVGSSLRYVLLGYLILAGLAAGRKIAQAVGGGGDDPPPKPDPTPPPPPGPAPDPPEPDPPEPDPPEPEPDGPPELFF